MVLISSMTTFSTLVYLALETVKGNTKFWEILKIGWMVILILRIIFLFNTCPPSRLVSKLMFLPLHVSLGTFVAQFWRQNEQFEMLIVIAVPRWTVYAHFSGSSKHDSGWVALQLDSQTCTAHATWTPFKRVYKWLCVYASPQSPILQNRRSKTHLFVSLRSAIMIAVFPVILQKWERTQPCDLNA